MTNRKSKILTVFLLFLSISCLPFISRHLIAQDNNELTVLTKQIMEASADRDLYAPFEELKNLYLKENKYEEFSELLKSLAEQKEKLKPFTNYYLALNRFNQLKYLEDTNSWDEYFSKGNIYRQELTEAAQKTIDSVASTDPLSIYAKFILWKFHQYQQDVFSESSLQTLIEGILVYPRGAAYLLPLKEVADELAFYGKKGKAKEVYRIYIDSITTADTKDEELNSAALGFYKEGKLELAEAVYDAYLERIGSSYPKEKIIPILIDIAKEFAFEDAQERDPLYAEKIFKKIEEIGTKDAFGEELIYLRAFNLEKAKEFALTKDIYLDLAQRYAQGSHVDEAEFKAAIIYAYISRDIDNARSYFTKLAQKEKLSPHVLSSLYQLGLLSQWEEDYAKAVEYYNKLLDRAEGNFPETEALTRERLEEIKESKPIEYNLKTFLDLSLKEENAIFNATKIGLSSSLYRIGKDTDINVSSATYGIESGSMAVEVQYLWSGSLGTYQPTLDESAFVTAYKQIGTKVINLVVVSSSGPIDRNIDIVDVY